MGKALIKLLNIFGALCIIDSSVIQMFPKHIEMPKHCPPCHSSSLQSGHFRACTTHRDVCSTKWCNIYTFIYLFIITYILWESVIALLCTIVQTDFFPSHWIQPLRSSLASEASYKLCHSCRSLNCNWFPIPNNPCLQLWWKIECNVNHAILWWWVSWGTPRPLWFHDLRPAHQKHGKLEKTKRPILGKIPNESSLSCKSIIVTRFAFPCKPFCWEQCRKDCTYICIYIIYFFAKALLFLILHSVMWLLWPWLWLWLWLRLWLWLWLCLLRIVGCCSSFVVCHLFVFLYLLVWLFVCLVWIFCFVCFGPQSAVTTRRTMSTAHCKQAKASIFLHICHVNR